MAALIDYVQDLRIEEAKRLLESSERSADTISAEVGYEDASFFRRVFKRRTGLTPMHYRWMFQPIREPKSGWTRTGPWSRVSVATAALPGDAVDLDGAAVDALEWGHGGLDQWVVHPAGLAAVVHQRDAAAGHAVGEAHPGVLLGAAGEAGALGREGLASTVGGEVDARAVVAAIGVAGRAPGAAGR